MFKFIVNIISTSLVLFNTYNQFKAKKEDRNVRRLYTIYFKVMCIFLVFDNLLSFFLRIVPFYQIIKLFMIIWLSVPKCSGAVFVYRFYVDGLMKSYENDLDNLIEKSKLTFRQTLNKYYEMAYGKYKEKRNAAKSFIESKTIKNNKIEDNKITSKDDQNIMNENKNDQNIMNENKNDQNIINDQNNINENVINQIPSSLGINKKVESVPFLNTEEDDSTISILEDN